jgi:hypothetical protein
MNTKDYETTKYAKRKLALTESQRLNIVQDLSLRSKYKLEEK